MSHVEAFATEIKIESSDQGDFQGAKNQQSRTWRQFDL